MIRIAVIISIALIPCMSNALNLAGYYENTLLAEYNKKIDEHLLDVSKFRLDFRTGASDNELEFKGNVNFVAYHNDVTFDFTPYLPKAVRDSLVERDISATVTVDKLRIYLDNAYLTWRFGGFRLRIGRQQLRWGPAYSFNPTDLFHRKDMLDPTYEKEGVTALRLSYRWGIGGEFTGIMVPGDKFHSSGYAIRLATHVSAIGYDVGLTGHMVSDSTSLDPGSLEIRKQRRRALGLDFSGGLLGLGFWFEGNYNVMEIEQDFIRAVVGVDYTLENGLYMIFEGLYDERARTNTPYTVADWLESLYFAEPVTRYRFLAGVRKGVTGLIDGGIYWFGGMDGSMVVNPRFDLSVAQNADLSVFGAVTFGRENGQFPPGNYALTARITVYF